MFEFEIESPIKNIAKKHLHRYQGRDHRRERSCKIKKCRTAQSVESYLKAGEAVGQTIECMDGSFDVHEWCLYHSDILFGFLEGKLFKMSYK